MDNWKIEDGIPAPAKRQNASLYPWLDLQVGQSVLFPQEKALNVRSSLYRFRLAHSTLLFTTRLTSEGLRIWRIK